MEQVLSYRDRLPLRWLPLPQPLEGFEADRLAEGNSRLLAAVAMLSEHAPASDEPSEVELELRRVQLKLNLLLDLFGTFLAQQTPRPAALSLRLSWRGVSWSGEALAPGEGMVELYLSAVLPQPLRLPARILSSTAEETVAEFLPMPEPCQSALERHVFQQHRRQVAETRQPARHAG